MKKIILKTLSVLSILLIIGSCTKKGIVSYPVSTNYGENLLSMSGDLVKGESYSVEANLSKKTTMKIVIVNTSNQNPDLTIPIPRWAFTYEKGWKAGNYENGQQTFETATPGNNDMKIVFQGTPGSCRIDFYENSSIITNTKLYNW